MQKVVIAHEFSCEAAVLVVAERSVYWEQRVVFTFCKEFHYLWPT